MCQIEEVLRKKWKGYWKVWNTQQCSSQGCTLNGWHLGELIHLLCIHKTLTGHLRLGVHHLMRNVKCHCVILVNVCVMNIP